MKTGYVDAALNQLEIVYRELVGLDTMGELNPGGAFPTCSTYYSSSLVYDGPVGRPHYDIPVSIFC